MKNAKITHIIKAIIFVIIFCFIFFPLQEILRIKYVYPENINQTEFAFQDLYSSDNNSIEVLCLGSSQVCMGFSPVELYNHSGYSSIVLGNSDATFLDNYFFLQEVRKTQDIKLVLLDMSSLYEEYRSKWLYASLAQFKWSKLKLEYLNTATSEVPTKDKYLYLFPIIQFHRRWDNLEEHDINMNQYRYTCYLGNSVLTTKENPDCAYSRLVIDNEKLTGTPVHEPVDYQLKYLEKIVAYCDENGIDLILFKTPKRSWNLSDAVIIQEYADEWNVPYIDFNYEANLKAMGYESDLLDMHDKDHLSPIGADKMTDYLGDYISENYNYLTDYRQDSSFRLNADLEAYNKQHTAVYEQIQEFAANGGKIEEEQDK